MKRAKIILTFFLALSSCGYRIEKEPAGKENIGDIPIHKMGYNQVQSFVLQKKCSQCHAWGSANNYDLVKLRIGDIQARVVSGNMPAANSSAGPLTATEKEILLSWIERGAPQEANQEAPPVPAPTPVIPPPCAVNPADPLDPCVGFSEVRPVLQNKCSQCHGFHQSYELTFSKKEKMFTLVEDGTMPEFGSEELTDFEKAMLLNWLKKGAPQFGATQTSKETP